MQWTKVLKQNIPLLAPIEIIFHGQLIFPMLLFLHLNTVHLRCKPRETSIEQIYYLLKNCRYLDMNQNNLRQFNSIQFNMALFLTSSKYWINSKYLCLFENDDVIKRKHRNEGIISTGSKKRKRKQKHITETTELEDI